MKEYKRPYPLFALCGLNCGLCPRYQTEGKSRCPGCGGTDFHLQHPTCAVITCNQKHDNVEFCFQCSSFPCQRYSEPGKLDSFISYRNVLTDLGKAKQNLARYRKELDEKIELLAFLLASYNDGRRKNFYCLAVNLLPLPLLREVKQQIDTQIAPSNSEIKKKTKLVVDLIAEKAELAGVELKLRK